jgi:hypothetical protein
MNNINNIFNISNIDNINKKNIDELSNINELNIFNYSKLRKMKRRIYENKYETTLEYLLNKSIPKRNIKQKINNDNYFLPNIKNYRYLLDYDFKLSNLKDIAKEYNLKVGGNKDMLLLRIYNYLHLTSNILKIQSSIRRYYVKKYILLQGPGRIKRDLCVNTKDFCTMVNIDNIPINQFISFKFDDNYIYGYDIMSIYNLFLQGNSHENPFTKKKFDSNVLKKILDFIRYSNLIGITINTDFYDLIGNNDLDKLNLRAINIFHKINMLGNYANSYWFTSLSRDNLILFVKELLDIWNYRANLEEVTKKDICPPNGNPFKNIVSSNINLLEFIKIKKIATIIIEIMINNGIDEENRKLGAFYVLCGLTLVNIDAANAMPWLYQSVMHI